MAMKIDGMSCGHCASQVRKALEALDGVDVQQVTVGSATLTHDPATAPESRIREAVEAAGYQVSAVTR
ncbi:MAG TPA: heavy-metal-associated domain-containing protein [Gemmatimonadaceae bacterium]